MSHDVLTIKEVAERLKMAEKTVYSMAQSGELPMFKLRGQWRIRLSDFQAWLADLAGDTDEPLLDWETVLRALPLYIWATTPDGIVRMASRAPETLTYEFKGSDVLELVREEHQDEFRDAIRRVVDHREQIEIINGCSVVDDAHLMVLSPIVDSGSAIGALVVAYPDYE